jgi:hypothetical protein
MKTIISVVAVLALSLTLATAAFGQSSVSGYNGQAGQVQSDVQGDTNAQPVVANSSGGGGGGSLPFTGLDVALLVGAGGLLIVAGLGMRRLTRPASSA